MVRNFECLENELLALIGPCLAQVSEVQKDLLDVPPRVPPNRLILLVMLGWGKVEQTSQELNSRSSTHHSSRPGTSMCRAFFACWDCC